jgi:hypothetical protein
MKLDEKNCYVYFKSQKPQYGLQINQPQLFNVSIIELYNYYSEGKCLIIFDQDMGFYFNPEVNNGTD